MNMPSFDEHQLIAAGLTMGTGTYVMRWIIIDAIAAIFEIVENIRERRSKLKG